MSSRFSKAILFFLVIFTPLAFGTVEPWSYAVMEILTAAGFLLFVISLVRERDTLHAVPGMVPLLLFLAFSVFQIIPLPPFVVEFLSPNAFVIQEKIAALTNTHSWMTLSVNQQAGLFEFFRYSTYVMFYFLTVQILKEKDTLQTMALVVAVFGGLLAFSSILQFYLTKDMALWFRYSPENSIVVGPYVNHNHYAGLMEMIFPIVLALFFFYRPRIGNTSFFRGIAEILSQEKANIHILIGSSALLILVSIFVSLSRGAMISTALALVLFFFLLLKRKISRGNTALVIGLVVVATLAIGWFGWGQILDRFAKLQNTQGVVYEARLDFWKDSSKIIRDFKLTGSGLGTFAHIYPPYKSLVDDRTLSHAHNDYIELLVEGGGISFVLIAAFLIAWFRKTYKAFSGRRDAFSIYLYMGSLTAMAAILIHSFTDFNLHIGANGLWFFFIAGLGVSFANTNIRRKNTLTRLKPVTASFKKTFFISGGTLLAVAAIAYNLSTLVGVFYFNHIKNVELSDKTPVATAKKIDAIAKRVIKFDPFHAQARYVSANAAWLLTDMDAAASYFKVALHLDPLNSSFLKQYGNFLAREKYAERAETAFFLSTLYSPTLAEYAFQYATWLLSKDKKKQGLVYLKKSLELDEKYADRVLTAMILAGLSYEEMETAIPDLPGPFLTFAQFLYTTGKREAAAIWYMKALDLAERQKPARHWQFYKIYQFFIRQNNYKNAMEVMERAERALPMNSAIKVTLGDLYRQQGILYKALEKYEQALYVDPKNKQALKKIEQVNN
jgi:O-antigen ligase/tetratricopeptide (TPR) repeat protein